MQSQLEIPDHTSVHTCTLIISSVFILCYAAENILEVFSSYTLG
jgi:hypothetical protein